MKRRIAALLIAGALSVATTVPALAQQPDDRGGGGDRGSENRGGDDRGGGDGGRGGGSDNRGQGGGLSDREERQRDQGHRIPEVPLAALYPAAGVAVIGAYWLYNRRRAATVEVESATTDHVQE